MTGTLNSAGKPTPIKAGGCPWCGMGIQMAGTIEAYCGWCAWKAKPRIRVRVGIKREGRP